MKKKILSSESLEQEYQAKIAATAGNLNQFYIAATNLVITHNDAGTPVEDIYMALDQLALHFATHVVDDISPKRNILSA